MEELVKHWYWEIDIKTNIYSLFVLTIPKSPEYDPSLHNNRYIYYTHSFYNVEENCWDVISTRELPAMMIVVHDGFLYGIYHNIMTDFEYMREVPIDGISRIEQMIANLCHSDERMEPEVKPSIDNGSSGLRYPNNLEDIFRWPPERFDAFMAYITKGGKKDVNGNNP